MICVALRVTVNMILMHDFLAIEMNELLERVQSLQLQELRETAEVAVTFISYLLAQHCYNDESQPCIVMFICNQSYLSSSLFPSWPPK